MPIKSKMNLESHKQMFITEQFVAARLSKIWELCGCCFKHGKVQLDLPTVKFLSTYNIGVSLNNLGFFVKTAFALVIEFCPLFLC